VLTIPRKIKGGSTGFIPNQVKMKKIITKGQNIISWLYMVLLYWILYLFIPKGIRIMIDMIKAITPPSLLGMDRRIA